MLTRSALLLSIFLLHSVTSRLSENDKAFLLSYLGEDFTSLVSPSGETPAPLQVSGLTEVVDLHEHDHKHKERHYHKAKGGVESGVIVTCDC